MSKATSRKLRRQLERKARQRERDEAAAKTRRLKGFKPANTGDMLREISRRAR